MESAGPLELRGFRDPIAAFRPLSAHGGVHRLGSISAPFVGRDAELDLLSNMLERTIRDKRPHVFTVYGEPGVGKSRLVREFLAGAEGVTILAGRALPYGVAILDAEYRIIWCNDSSESHLSINADGDVGQPISVPKGLAVIQAAEVVPEHVPTLDEVRARVEQDYRAEQSRVLASEKAKQFAAAARSGDFKKIAKTQHLDVKESKDFTRQDSVSETIPASAVAAAFTLAPGQTSDVAAAGTNSVVFHVLSHTPPNEADFAAQQGQIAEDLLGRKREVAFEIYQQNLKQWLLQSKELKMNDAAMKQFLASYAR